MNVIWCFFFLAMPYDVRGAFGGDDLFSSLSQLEVLWKNEIQVVKHIEEMVQKGSNNSMLIDRLQRYIDSHKELQLNQTPNFDFLGHPLNAYHFVRHVAIGWGQIRSIILKNDTKFDNEDDIEFLRQREKEKLPNDADIDGASFGLVRLHSIYNLDIRRFINEGVIIATFANGQRVESQPSVQRISAFELGRMAQAAGDNQLFDMATDLFELARERAEEEIRNNITIPFYELIDYKPNPKELKILTQTAKKVHDHVLTKQGMRGRHHKTHPLPFDKKLRKKKKYKKRGDEDLPLILGRETFNHWDQHLQSLRGKEIEKTIKANVATQIQVEKLCRGETLLPPSETANLYCAYVTGGSPWLKLGPIKFQLNSNDPYHVVFKELLYPHECDAITEFLGPKLDFPPGRMDQRSKKNDWTMKNCWPTETENVYLDKLNRRIEHVTGLRANASKGYSEPFMCGNYGIGGYYYVHPDYHPDEPRLLFPGVPGNRLSTILTILEAPIAGGATVWPYAGISTFPEKGAGVFWFNTLKSSQPDTFTRHAACPVLLGQKWIGNKWVGYNAQWNGRKCAVNPFEKFMGPFA